MVVHTCNPCSQEVKEGDCESEASLGYLVRPCLQSQNILQPHGYKEENIKYQIFSSSKSLGGLLVISKELSISRAGGRVLGQGLVSGSRALSLSLSSYLEGQTRHHIQPAAVTFRGFQ
jgi:hypothetical protein